MRIKYKAVGNDGKIIQGLMEANNLGEAASYLRSKEFLPVTISKSEPSAFLKYIPFTNKVKSHEVVFFTRQLASMLSSGLTLLRALEILREQIENKAMRDVVSGIIADVEGGRTFSASIEAYPEIFSSIYSSIIKAGESSGLLDKSLLRLADNLEKQSKLRRTIRGALLYPIIVVVLMVAVIFVMMIFVIPQLTGLYTDLNVDLPLPTRIVVGMSSILTVFWPFVIASFFGSAFLFRKWRKTEAGMRAFDKLLLRLPVFGKLIRQSILAEFSRTFGLLVGTGTLVVDALVETSNIAGNVHYKQAILNVSRRVEKGTTIGDAMTAHTLFPPILIQLTKIGEQTGKLDESLIKASEYFEGEVDQTVKTLTTAMEPFIMIGLGLGVAFLIIAVISPIYSLISQIQ